MTAATTLSIITYGSWTIIILFFAYFLYKDYKDKNNRYPPTW